MKFLFAVAALFWGAVATAAPQPHKVLYVDQVIMEQSLAPITAALKEIVVSKKDYNIDIVINSPGGEVISGMEFVNLMAAARSQGSVIRCYVTGMAASMAFQILTQCDQRYALTTSFMLWHGVRIQTMMPITTSLAGQIQRSLAQIDDLIRYQLYSSVRLPRKQIDEAFDDERFWTGVSLHQAAPRFIKLKDNFGELYPEAKDGVHMSVPSGFSVGDQIMYIWQGYRMN